MKRCPRCSAPISSEQRLCNCGAAVGSASDVGTVAMGSAAVAAGSKLAGRRFPAESVIAQRYRVVGLLGKGGMGEVYKAEDLLLEQTVALKFLPEGFGVGDRVLERFRGEVRLARQVSHPNVCRVYDIGEVDGAPFLSMEYVDGEDFASLLRRIGRLPGDKALDVAHRLCAGLAAAHDKGILHRDLKPSNVMIDGRGELLITDFGLAAICGQIAAADLRQGTEAYMAPEQLAGREVTVRSDIYALGLVLYEAFTGKRAFQAQSAAELRRLQVESTPPGITTVAKDVDPAVERAILRCLAPDPMQRPASARAVAASLPGGDPLAMALAAGETPSPEMVAAAGEGSRMSVAKAAFCCLAVMCLLPAVIFLAGRPEFPGSEALPREVLIHTARNVAASSGYAAPPRDWACGVFGSTEYFKWFNEHPQDHALRTEARFSPTFFWYRQSPDYLLPSGFSPVISRNDPAPTRPGMVETVFDPRGRLVRFSAAALADARDTPASNFEWARLFQAADLRIQDFAPDPPRLTPRTAYDNQAAWVGPAAGQSSPTIRVEAAAYRGRPVQFEVTYAWGGVPEDTEEGFNFWYLMVPVVMAIALPSALRNHRTGRGDRKSAVRFAAIVGCLLLVYGLLSGHFTATRLDWKPFNFRLAIAVWVGTVTWVLYTAIEPVARRVYPESLISWTRLLSGGFRDPLVGRDLLLGMLSSGAIYLLTSAGFWLDRRTDEPWRWLFALRGFHGVRFVVADLAGAAYSSLHQSMFLMTLLVLLWALTRNRWIAWAALFVLAQALLLGAPHWDFRTLFLWAALLVVYMTISHAGFLAFVCAGITNNWLVVSRLMLDDSGWFSANAYVAGLLWLATAAYAFYIALAGRRVFQRSPLADA